MSIGEHHHLRETCNSDVCTGIKLKSNLNLTQTCTFTILTWVRYNLQKRTKNDLLFCRYIAIDKEYIWNHSKFHLNKILCWAAMAWVRFVPICRLTWPVPDAYVRSWSLGQITRHYCTSFFGNFPQICSEQNNPSLSNLPSDQKFTNP